MSYIIFDLEWNQACVKAKEVKGIMFEILEIGAIKMDDSFHIIDSYSSLVRPQVYMTMHSATRRILHFDLKAMRKNERPFPVVMEEFLSWCGPSPIFCTWGPSDLTELRRNMKYYDLMPLSPGPLKYFDVQKLFSLKCGDGHSRISLENAVDHFHLSEAGHFHRALDDARYTARIFARIADPSLLCYHSYDTFSLPSNRKNEVHCSFPSYYKYISRAFRNKYNLLSDKEVLKICCNICNSKVKRVVKWFSTNGGRYYLAVSSCQEHGYIKGKLRVKKNEDEEYYAVKTVKPISEELAQSIEEKYERSCGKGKKPRS